MTKKQIPLITLLLIGVLVVGYAVFHFVRPSADNVAAAPSVALPAAAPEDRAVRNISAAEVALHASQSDCWTIVDGKVYDVTSFISRHPGGADAIAKACGVDATKDFKSVKKHGNSAVELLPTFLLGNASR